MPSMKTEICMYTGPVEELAWLRLRVRPQLAAQDREICQRTAYSDPYFGAGEGGVAESLRLSQASSLN